MPRSRIFGIYGLLVVFALGAGLLVARLFGATTVLPDGYATPAAGVGQAATAASSATSAPLGREATTAPEPTGAPIEQATATPPEPAGATSPTVTTVTDAPAATAAPSPEPPTSAPTAAPTDPPATAASDYIEYTVQKGDSLKGIAEKHAVTIREILAINQIPDPDSLVVGAVLRIPKK